eukprot:sb/3479452/
MDSGTQPPVRVSPHCLGEVSEISDKGTDIVRVTATDSDIGVNSEIRYYLVSIVTKTADRSSPISFSINSKTGIITSGSTLDLESHRQVKLVIEARDEGSEILSSRALVVVDIVDLDDNGPVVYEIKEYYELVTPLGGVQVFICASEAVFGSYTYLFLGQFGQTKVLRVHKIMLFPVIYGRLVRNEQRIGLTHFNLLSNKRDKREVWTEKNPDLNETYEICQVSELDYEVQKSYNLVVEAVDSGGRRGVASVEIILRDLNDNSPRFSQAVYRATLLHTVLPGTPVTRLDTCILIVTSFSYHGNHSYHGSPDENNFTKHLSND